LLFPLLFREYFQEICEFHNYGLIKSDNTHFGALPTKSYKALLNETKIKADIVVIGGGEVFFSKWNKLYSYINPLFESLLKIKIFKFLENKFNIASIILSGKSSYSPYIPSQDVPVIYLSAGGQFSKSISSKDKNLIIKKLKNSMWLSVRDNRTLEALKKDGIMSRLLPDTALLVSETYPIQEVRKKSSLDDDLMVKPYIYLQVGLNKGPDNLNMFVNHISELAKKESLRVICCPIGLAPGHRDDIILKKMVNLSANWTYINPESIFDIINLIANSKIYVGTSLHGAITAYAYGVPILPLNKKIKKLDSFVETWTNEFYIKCVDFPDVIDGYYMAKAKWDSNLAKKKLKLQQAQLLEDFSILKSLISNL
jgi:polysaccharide pyruvyl transferase WcaK-like protein